MGGIRLLTRGGLCVHGVVPFHLLLFLLLLLLLLLLLQCAYACVIVYV